jgi:hypothetical protein
MTSQGRKRDKNQKIILYRQEHLLRKYTITHTHCLEECLRWTPEKNPLSEAN